MYEFWVEKRFIIGNAFKAGFVEIGSKYLVHIGELVKVRAVETNELEQCKERVLEREQGLLFEVYLLVRGHFRNILGKSKLGIRGV
jgi:hypothetical protein